ncbi:MAG: hypothetical protein HY667_04760 [Chloroflexi bacterium]|nr:hypothetical protein [Chloroflexota bacterium]
MWNTIISPSKRLLARLGMRKTTDVTRSCRTAVAKPQRAATFYYWDERPRYRSEVFPRGFG